MVWTRPDNLHSRLVFWLKILLPLSALGILSTLFLLSHSVRPEDAIPYSTVNIADRVKEPRLTAPDFAGMTADGAALTLHATDARPGTSGSSDAGLINDLTGQIDTPDGARTTLVAKQARLDQTAKQVVIDGGAVITNSTGYRIETRQIRVALDQTSLDSDGPIDATGPVGHITAGSLHLGLAVATPAQYVLVFKGGVRLIYLPSRQGTSN